MLFGGAMIYWVYLHLFEVLLRTVLAVLCIALAARLLFEVWGRPV